MTDLMRIQLQAELSSPFHTLGPGRVVALVDRPIELDAQGYPFIPASSIRGRLRVHLERLLRQVGYPVCTPPVPDRMCPHAGYNDYCLVCRIFGSVWRPAAVVSTDLRLVAPRPAPTLLRSERTAVGISRRLGTAQAERLFTLESADARADGVPLRFEGNMIGRLEADEAGWLLAAVSLVTHLGGSKARGLGEVSMSVKEVACQRNGAWHSVDPTHLIEEVLDHASA